MGRNMKPHLRSWPSKGADLCPLDCGAWNQVQGQVWKDEPKTMVELRISALRHLVAYPQECIEKAIRSFPKRRAMCVGAEGGWFEYKLR